MQIVKTSLRDVKLLQPRLFEDDRGWFAEVFNATTYSEAGFPSEFVQDNQSSSHKGVLRGLHYQLERPQGKLVRVLSGRIWDVAVDLRRNSQDFGRWAGFYLQPLTDAGTLQVLWVPEGFAHGLLVLSDTAEVLYKTTNFYDPADERSILWSDLQLAIEWPIHELDGMGPSVSAKDAAGKLFSEADLPATASVTT